MLILFQSRQYAAEAYIVVSVVDENSVITRVGIDFRSPAHCGAGQSLSYRPVGDAQGPAYGDSSQSVRHIEGPWHGEKERLRNAVYEELAAQQAVAPHRTDSIAPDIRSIPKAKSGYRAAWPSPSPHQRPIGIIQIAHRFAALGKQGGLTGAVLVKISVLRRADVVRGEVEKYSGVKADPRHPA